MCDIILLKTYLRKIAAQNSQNVFLFHKFSYCKHKDWCRKQHVKKVCDNISCEILNSPIPKFENKTGNMGNVSLILAYEILT